MNPTEKSVEAISLLKPVTDLTNELTLVTKKLAVENKKLCVVATNSNNFFQLTITLWQCFVFIQLLYQLCGVTEIFICIYSGIKTGHFYSDFLFSKLIQVE